VAGAHDGIMKAPLAAGAGGRRKAAHAARPGRRSRSSPSPREQLRVRVYLDASIGFGIYCLFWWHLANYFPPWWLWVWLWPLVMALWVMGWSVLAFGAVFLLGEGIRGSAGWMRRKAMVRPRLALGLAAATAAAAAVAAIGAAGIALARLAAAVLPAVFVAACGLWVCLLAARKAPTPFRAWVQRLPGWFWLPRWIRRFPEPFGLPDAVGVATVAASIVLLVRHDLLTAEPAAGFLFPLALWGSTRVWRAMKSSGRLAARAGADIVLSLLLGAELVLVLVWLANLLGLPQPEVAALRTVLIRAGMAADLPWWVWTVLYAVLAGLSLAFVLRPGRTIAVKRWFGRLRVVPAANAARRVLSGVHIGLLIIVLVGLITPPALASTLQRKLATAYTVALERQFQAEGELAAYQQIRRRFVTGGIPPALVQVVTQIDDADRPPPGDTNATGAEDELARQVGALQAAAQNLRSSQALLAEEESATRRAGFDSPLDGEPDAARRVDEVDAQDQDDDTAQSNTAQAGELAASALASTITIAGAGGHQVAQILTEYLSGLFEESGVKDSLAALAEKLPGASTAPDPDEMIIPQPRQLEHAAYQELAREFAAQGDMGDLDFDQAVINAPYESPIRAAVSLAVQTLPANAGSCASCQVPGGGGSDDEQPPVPPDDDG